LEGKPDGSRKWSGKHLHYHAVIDCPRDKLAPGYIQLLAGLWRHTDWGDIQADVRPADQGWVAYMTKFKDKPFYDEDIDLVNCRLPDG
jgi:hypothetical protein